ncbi:MAG: hypothetical protein AAB788_03535 [Patescibacteria group bacterium]
MFLSIYFVFSPGWFVQRALFIVPSLLLLSAFSKNIFKILILLYVVYFGYVLFFFPGLFDHSLLRPILNIQTIDYSSWPINQLKIIIFSALGSIYSYLIYLIIREKPENEVDLKSVDILLPFLSLVLYLGAILTLLFVSGTS